MTATAGDSVTATVLVNAEPGRAFDLFTNEIDRWWLRGPKYRQSGRNQGLFHIEPRLGGRIFESWVDERGEQVFEVGRITEWCPPRRFAFSWRNQTFAERELTLVEVEFRETDTRTAVTVTHRGWSNIRADHPARHQQATDTFLRGLGLWWGEQLSSLRRLGNDA